MFAIVEHELRKGEDVLAHVIERQLFYFADKEGLAALLKYLGDSPWVEAFTVLRDHMDVFNDENPRRSFPL